MNLEAWAALFSFSLSVYPLHTYVVHMKQQSSRKCDHNFYLSTLSLLIVVSWANLKRSQEKEIILSKYS